MNGPDEDIEAEYQYDEDDREQLDGSVYGDHIPTEEEEAAFREDMKTHDFGISNDDDMPF